MSINQKNLQLWNAVSSSQWKIVPQQDEPDDVLNEQTQIKPESHSTRLNARQRLLRDATAFYRNDTSLFLGELQQAETQLYEKVNSVSKIDFLPPKRKSSHKAGSHYSQSQAFVEQLSDSNTAPYSKTRKIDHKKSEPEKLIVDVIDFVETFSVFRDPFYLRENIKNTSEPETKSEFDFLLEQVQQRREKYAVCETIDNTSEDSEDMGHVSFNDIAKDMDTIHEQTTICQDVFSFVDSTIVADGTIQHQASSTFGTMANVYPCHLEINQNTSDISRGMETLISQSEIKVSRDHDEATHIDEQELSENMVSHDCTSPVFSIEANTIACGDQFHDTAAGESQATDASTQNGNPSEVVKNHFTFPVVVQLPDILEQLGELAGVQCDGLADYIKDKVYDGSRLIAFCGMKRRVGCSTMTMLAAKGIMRHGLKTAIIDANFEFPRLNAMVTGQRESEASWINILHGTASWETLGITPKDIPLFTIFPLAENSLVNWSQHEPERLQQETNRFVLVLQEYFDLILFDCGCFEDSFEEITWGELALFQPDGVVLVCNPRETPLEMLEPCCQELLSGNIEVFGVAENFV